MNRYELSAYAITLSNFLKDNASAGNERFQITINEWELAAQLDKLAKELRVPDKSGDLRRIQNDQYQPDATM